MSDPKQPIKQPTFVVALSGPLPGPGSGQKPLARPRRRKARRGWNVNQRPNGTWLASVSDPNTYVRQTKTFRADQRIEAERWADQTRAKFTLLQATPGATRFSTLADEYLQDLERRARASATVTNIRRVIAAMKAGRIVDLAAANTPALASKILQGLTTTAGKPASPATRNTYLAKMRTIAAFAIKRGHLVQNPFLRVDKQPEVHRLREVFTLDELGRLLDPVHREHPFYRAFACLLYAGFRQSEVRFMDWNWFLWDAQRIQMVLADQATATLSHAQAQHVLRPKNGKARITRLPAELAAIMRPGAPPTGPVFPDLRHVDKDGFCWRFDRYIAHCGVERGRRSPHSCRSTWTCLMLASGENETLVKQYGGWSDKDMVEHYAVLQDRFRVQLERAQWPRGEIRLRDFLPRAVVGATVPLPVLEPPPLR